jgi:hypothetical protein
VRLTNYSRTSTEDGREEAQGERTSLFTSSYGLGSELGEGTSNGAEEPPRSFPLRAEGRFGTLNGSPALAFLSGFEFAGATEPARLDVADETLDERCRPSMTSRARRCASRSCSVRTFPTTRSAGSDLAFLLDGAGSPKTEPPDTSRGRFAPK